MFEINSMETTILTLVNPNFTIFIINQSNLT
jgi:hypothetical protein